MRFDSSRLREAAGLRVDSAADGVLHELGPVGHIVRLQDMHPTAQADHRVRARRSSNGKRLSGVTTPSTRRAAVRLTTGKSPPLCARRSSTTSRG